MMFVVAHDRNGSHDGEDQEAGPRLNIRKDIFS